MQTRPLGTTGLSLPVLGFGASSLGQEFRNVTVEEARALLIAKIGENIQVRRFVRFTLGEGIEVQKMDFAAEVAAMQAA